MTEIIKGSGEKVDKIEIIEQHVEIDGEDMILVSVEGLRIGASISQADVDSGAINMQDIYETMAQAWLCNKYGMKPMRNTHIILPEGGNA